MNSQFAQNIRQRARGVTTDEACLEKQYKALSKATRHGHGPNPTRVRWRRASVRIGKGVSLRSDGISVAPKTESKASPHGLQYHVLSPAKARSRGASVPIGKEILDPGKK